jgi:hypothetical protein
LWPTSAPSSAPATLCVAATSGLLSPAAERQEGSTMTLYLTRFSYTPEAWARLAEKPEDRRDAARQ